MERDEIYLIDLWRTVIREWRWFVASLVGVLAITFAFTHSVRHQWEATAWIQIGQVGLVPVGQDPKVEPLQRVTERLQTADFQNAMMKSVGFSPNSPEARLYHKSLKLEPMLYAGSLIKLSVRAYSQEQARQFAMATVDQLRAVHQRIEATPLTLARTRLDELQADLQAVIAERDQLQKTATSGNKDDATSRTGSDPLLAGVFLSSKNDEIRGLKQSRSDIVDRLSANYTYETSLVWPVYVPENQAFPNPVLAWGLGLLLGISLGAFAAVARSASRRPV